MQERPTDYHSVSRLGRFWLRDRDSNPDRLIQSQLSYRWTIPQRAAYSTTTGRPGQALVPRGCPRGNGDAGARSAVKSPFAAQFYVWRFCSTRPTHASANMNQ